MPQQAERPPAKPEAKPTGFDAFDNYWSCRICGFPHSTDELGRKRTPECRRRQAMADAEAEDEEESRRQRRALRRDEWPVYYARLDEQERQADRMEDDLNFGQIDRPRSYSERLSEGFHVLNN